MVASETMLFYETFGFEEVAHEAFDVADLALNIGALFAELSVTLALRLLLADQDLDLGLFLLAVARSRIFVLLLLAGSAVVRRTRVRFGA